MLKPDVGGLLPSEIAGRPVPSRADGENRRGLPVNREQPPPRAGRASSVTAKHLREVSRASYLTIMAATGPLGCPVATSVSAVMKSPKSLSIVRASIFAVSLRSGLSTWPRRV